MKPIEVVFCGNSVYLWGLATGLQQIEQFRVSMVDNTVDKSMPELKILCPDAVIFEAANNTPRMTETLHRFDSRLTVIGVYPETDSLEVFGDERCFTSSVDNLVQVIHEAVSAI